MHSLPLFYIFNSFLHFSSECSIFCVRGVMENDSVKEGSSIPIFMDFNPLKSLNAGACCKGMAHLEVLTPMKSSAF